ncbi:MAG: 4Fe-4S binding protein [Candidatus Wallbacteria bacterium]|nr:4Fe-4S binding protein [Candidatus Wallbacteria bacterium]
MNQTSSPTARAFTRRQRFHRAVQALRRLVQIASIALVLALVTLSLYAHYRATRAIEDPTLTRGWRGSVLLAVHQAVGRLPSPQAFLDSCKGTHWSMRVLGLDLTDPLAAAEALAASKRVHWPLLLGALVPILLTVLLGRVFCSWLCPANVLFELSGKLRGLLAFAEIPPADVRFSRANKYVLLAVGLAAAAVLGLPFFALVYPPAVLGRAAHGWIFQTAAVGSLAVLGLIVAVELFVSPRWWCRTMCPGGALYALLGALRPLRVRLDAAKCTGCKECVPVCEPGLNPVRESARMECDNCAACIRHCPEDALVFRLGTSSAPFRSSAPPVALLLGLVLAMPLQAHHILGLPHYAYKENYPQVPQLEYPAAAGPYDILLTSYPGNPVPGEKTIIAVYIKDRTTGRAYEGEIGIRALRSRLFSDPEPLAPAVRVVPCEVPHKTTVTFPEAGDYWVELTFDVEGKPESIPFPIVAGNPSPAGAVVTLFGGVMLTLLVTVRAIRIKRARRARAEGRAA